MQQKEFIEISETIEGKEYRVLLPLGGKYDIAAEFFGKLCAHFKNVVSELEKKKNENDSLVDEKQE